ncbi:hypothetical protein MLD38_024296 [Melastoma candidum]|uniref:Uncharacterized protein n=1 Tax=Melastoma candidum TaxID=119954 RepID=A0ACB9NRL0_9MYRT|nr:hypothetical protein MLD38_024296 [Melastoma candidum]
MIPRKMLTAFLRVLKQMRGGSTTVSDILGDGNTGKVSIVLSGYPSLTLDINKVPIPEPVPLPSEWQTWKPTTTKSTGITARERLLQFMSANAFSKTGYFR